MSDQNQAHTVRGTAPAVELVEPAARALAWGLPALGAVKALHGWLLNTDKQGMESSRDPIAVLDALFLAGIYVLGGIVASALLRVVGRWIALQEATQPAQASAVTPSSAAAIASSDVPAASPPDLAPQPAAPATGPADAAVAEFRRFLREGKWDDAMESLADLSADHAQNPRVIALREDLDAARESARRDQMAKLDAARQVNDPERVLEVHGLVAPLLEMEARHTLEADLGRWFLRLIHNRIRTGKIQVDVVELAGRVADAFSHTADGASLRASLPTLRRSAGLCPRCAQPFTGLASACPACLNPAAAPVRPDQGA